MKGSALRHSVERLVIDTVFVTFGMQWTGLSSTLHSANDPSIGQQYRNCVETTVVVDTLGPARRRTHGLCVTVRGQWEKKDRLDADLWTGTFAHTGLKSNASNIHLLKKSSSSPSPLLLLFFSFSSELLLLFFFFLYHSRAAWDTASLPSLSGCGVAPTFRVSCNVSRN